ncbi:MAG: hypothetical protein A2V66_05130 [Ignavibacteria bacterium RBG_13_36_8]|nr:MAG: hypothetical protein A2V66_05130 [Ignavibacteria bacterium RBG_13_36_8]
MDENLKGLFYNLGQQIIAYLPNLLAGILLLVVGWVAGWFIKRITVQLLVIFRVERLFTRFRMRSALSKADIKFALFNFIGNIMFFIVFLIFFNSALDALNLKVLSNLIEKGVLFFPKLIVALVIFGIGWFIAGRVSNSVLNALIKENIPHFSLIARFVKFIILIFFSAMALIELDIANEIVIIGFTTIMTTLGLLIVVITTMGRQTFLKEFFELGTKKKSIRRRRV